MLETISKKYLLTALVVGLITLTSQVDAQCNPQIISSEGNSLCPESGGTNLSFANTYDTYTWSTGDTSPTIFVEEGGTFACHVTAAGCDTTVSISIVEVAFDLEIIGSTPICIGFSVSLVASGGDTYAWSNGEFGNSIVVSPEQATTYSVDITKGSCQQTLSEFIEVDQLEDTEFPPDTVYMEQGNPVYVSGPSGFDTYEWAPEELVSGTNSISTTYTGKESGFITYSASKEEGCTVLGSVYFALVNLTVPEGFSPNGDMINDTFYIPDLDTLSGSLIVWNRWGNVVYQADNYGNNWDGTCHSEFCLTDGDLPEGTYFYVVSLGDIEQQGYLILKR